MRKEQAREARSQSDTAAARAAGKRKKSYDVLVDQPSGSRGLRVSRSDDALIVGAKVQR